MSLKIIKLKKQLEIKNNELLKIREILPGHEKQEHQFASEIQNAESEDELIELNEKIDNFLKDKKTLETTIKTLEEEIKEIEEEIKNQELKVEETTKNIEKTNRGEKTKMGRYNTIEDLLNNSNVRDYFNNLKEKIKRREEFVDKTIPTEVTNYVIDEVKDNSPLLSEITKIEIGGKGKINIANMLNEAIWLEQKDALKQLELDFKTIELDGFKVGGFVPLHDYVLEDSIDNLANLFIKFLKKSIQIALEKAVLFGNHDNKTPNGITNKLAAKISDQEYKQKHLIKTLQGQTKLTDFIKARALIEQADEVIYVMSSGTYYNILLPLIIKDAKISALYFGTEMRLPVLGARIVLNDNLKQGAIILGDFKKYLLLQRNDLQISTSTDVRFIEDQTLIKGVQRFDGDILSDKYFAFMSIEGLEENTWVKPEFKTE